MIDETNLIEGINPLTISKIRWTRGFRRGRHPRWLRLMKRKNPFRGILGIYTYDIFDYWSNAEVCIYGSDGNLILIKSFRSNNSAELHCANLNKKLNEFLKDLKRNDQVC